MTVTLTPAVTIPANGRIVITLSGAGLAVASPGTLTFTTGGVGGVGSATISSAGVLTVTMTAGNFTGGAALAFTIPGITNPTAAQIGSTTIAAATMDNAGVILGASATGTFVAIIDPLGENRPAVSLSSAVRGAGSVVMTVNLIPTSLIPATGMIVITLSGAGLAVASPGALNFTTGGVGGVGTATISAAGVLTVTMTAGTFSAGAALTFTIPGITNPTAAQIGSTTIAAATTNSAGVVIDNSNTGTFVAIVTNTLAAARPQVTLDSAIAGATGVVMTVDLTPTTLIPSNGKIIITLSGAGLAIVGAGNLTFTNGGGGTGAGSAQIAGTPPVLTVTMTAGTFTGNAQLTFTIPGVTNPTAAQIQSSTIAAATTTSAGVIIDVSDTGTFVAITSRLGAAKPAITLNNAVRGATGVVMTVDLTPATLIPSNGKIIITLSGAGLAIPGGGNLTFTNGGGGTGVGSAQIAGTPPVLTVTMTAGTFSAGTRLTFTIPGVTNPTAIQDASTTIAAATTNNTGAIVDTSATGTFVAIIDPLGAAKPAITLNNALRGATGVVMTVDLTPTTQIPSNGKIIITLSGAGLAIPGGGNLNFTNGGGGTGAGSAQIAGTPPVLTVTMTAGTFSAGTRLTFTIPGVTNPTAIQDASTTIAAATTNNAGAILDTSATGTFVAIIDALGLAKPAITLNNALRGAGGVIMTVSLTPTTQIPSTGKIVITLSGAGLAVGSPVASFSTLTFTAGGGGSGAGTATISAAGVLTVTMTAGTFSADTVLTFTIPGVTNPTAAQIASTTIAAATTNSAGTLIDTTTSGTFVAIVTNTLGASMPAITLSSDNSGASSVIMTVSLTPAVTIPATGRIVITLSGAGLAVASPGTLTFTTGGVGGVGSATISAAGVLTVVMTSGAFTGGAALAFTIPGITNPTAAQIASATIAAATMNNAGVLGGASDTGTFVAIITPVTQLTFTSITSGGVAGAAMNPVIVFQPKTTVPMGQTIILTMPAGYFLGSVSSITSSVATLTATSTPAATATSTTIVLTTGVVATGTSAITMTLTGLTLGGARAIVTGGFALSTSAEPTLTAGRDTAAITGITFTSITSGGVTGAAMNPVLVFTPFSSVPMGQTITLTMPAGYFLGSVTSIASSVATLTATSTPAMATNTSIVLTTGVVATATATITMTLTGLRLGAPQAIVTGGFALRTSADPGLSVALNSAAITSPSAATASSAPVSVVSVFSHFIAAFILYVALH
jgi:hypothetical protein